MIVTEGRKHSAQAKRDGDFEAICDEIAAIDCPGDLRAYAERLDGVVNGLPAAFRIPIADALKSRSREILMAQLDASYRAIMGAP